jgi:flagellar hook assembly protein FlgD
MRTAQGYEFTAGEDQRELKIRLAGGDGALALSVPAAHSTGAGAEITYTLSADAEVQVQILNIAGRTVDTVIDGDLQTAGAQNVTWDGLSARGTKAPNGTYLVVVSARAASGQQTQAIGTVSLGR